MALRENRRVGEMVQMPGEAQSEMDQTTSRMRLLNGAHFGAVAVNMIHIGENHRKARSQASGEFGECAQHEAEDDGADNSSNDGECEKPFQYVDDDSNADCERDNPLHQGIPSRYLDGCPKNQPSRIARARDSAPRARAIWRVFHGS